MPVIIANPHLSAQAAKTHKHTSGRSFKKRNLARSIGCLRANLNPQKEEQHGTRREPAPRPQGPSVKMPEPASPTAVAGQPPQPGQQQGGAPFGASPATGPTPNKGYEAAGLQRLGMAVKILTECLPMLGVSSEPGMAVMSVLPKLAKFVPPGTSTPASERNQMEQMMMRNVQQGGQMQQLRAQMGQQGGGAGGGGMPPGMAGARAA